MSWFKKEFNPKDYQLEYLTDSIKNIYTNMNEALSYTTDQRIDIRNDYKTRIKELEWRIRKLEHDMEEKCKSKP